MSFKVAIVGSGPSGATAARVLIAAGIQVDMFDIGTDIDTPLANTPAVEKSGLIPRKTLFGSSFMYRRRDSLKISAPENVSFDTSHAKGGLSSVWGATVGATTAHDIKDWPMSIDVLTKHLNDVFSNMPLSVRKDQIDIVYPLKLGGKNLPYENVQSGFILDSVNRNASLLNVNGIFIGKAKLAIDAEPGSPTSCVLCGQCMTGCERGSIFNAWSMVGKLKKNTNFKYLDNRVVRSFKENELGVEIKFVNLPSNSECSGQYNVLVLAAGCIDSTKIVDASLNWTGHQYPILDSQKYYFPVWVRRGGDIPSQGSIALAHLYVQGFDSNNNIIQGQLYPGRLIIQTVLKHLLGRSGQLIGRIISPLLSRFFVGVSYFSSAVSGRLHIRFDEDNGLDVTGAANPQSDKEFSSFISKLSRFRKQTGFSVFPGFKLRSKLGHSQHFGGTIPMRETPQKYEADTFGRPYGCKSVFVVDSTVLTSIPATPTTGLTMANASRIASFISELATKK